MKIKNVLWIIMMTFFISLAYLLFDRGLNVRTKFLVNYQENNDVIYKVFLHKNDIYNKDYLDMDERYISSLVDNIDINFKYNSLYDKDISGYYGYKVIGKVVAYQDDVNDVLWEKEDVIVNNKITVLDKNNLRSINIDDNVLVDYDKYKNELFKFSSIYGKSVNGYLEVSLIVNNHLNFRNISNDINEDRSIKVIIPLSSDNFKISLVKDNKNGSYSDFSNREDINYLLLVIGSVSLSLGISFLALVIRDIVISSKNSFDYSKELKKILRDNDSIIVNVKRFYNKKKYNLIYLNSFDELLSVYKKYKNPISYKEVKKGEEAIFLMTNDDDAWIYRLCDK